MPWMSYMEFILMLLFGFVGAAFAIKTPLEGILLKLTPEQLLFSFLPGVLFGAISVWIFRKYGNYKEVRLLIAASSGFCGGMFLGAFATFLN